MACDAELGLQRNYLRTTKRESRRKRRNLEMMLFSSSVRVKDNRKIPSHKRAAATRGFPRSGVGAAKDCLEGATIGVEDEPADGRRRHDELVKVEHLRKGGGLRGMDPPLQRQTRRGRPKLPRNG
jgi:hypothetical protein